MLIFERPYKEDFINILYHCASLELYRRKIKVKHPLKYKEFPRNLHNFQIGQLEGFKKFLNFVNKMHTSSIKLISTKMGMRKGSSNKPKSPKSTSTFNSPRNSGPMITAPKLDIKKSGFSQAVK